ncbi:RNA polymerase subunit sigma-70 [Nocardioides jishulii]|uniref:Sigma-70 family RNA polymerase sigma factor n=1 Tax=Nocardioides jishulii TaxID=2575440 RepID=A0A4U2YTF6_9ACTN|nr:RNA polymerase subunit sigma-70 [Nocardioides jishulii]QCX28984.1 sigma-70 family RNA polymerase sigma factor [Nocardioides jishulii]TKI64115.1 sigma-70 family RNA polymerase sigma factor [Nocardioides jishulii]
MGEDDVGRQGDFAARTSHLRTELLAHCYRMTGSLADAEDAVQETYLRAWKAFHTFEGRSSVRTWMYKVATNTCLSSLTAASRRVLPQSLGAPPGDPTAELVERDEAWLEPLPDAVLWQQATPTPEDELLAREDVTIAWIAALQHLPPNQRAALLLREVLQLSAEETAEVLGASVAAVNSALQRGRAGIGNGLPGGRVAGVDTEVEREAVRRFVDAFEAHDFDAIVASMSEGVTWQMPPFDRHYVGARDAALLSFTHCPARAAGDLRYLTTRSNGQPALGMYLREGRQYEAFQFQALTVSPDGLVDDVVGWLDPHFFRLAGLPLVLDA